MADLEDFEEAREHVRVHQIKELVQLETIELPLKASDKRVKLVSPGEDFIEADSTSTEETSRDAPPSR